MKKDLLKAIKKQEKEDTLPIVSLELFFEGNDDEGSIGCNLLEHPGVEMFYQKLKSIRDKDNVQDVFVEIYEVDDNDEYWPFSERVYILTNVSEVEVPEWTSELEPSDIGEGWNFGTPLAAPKLILGYKVYSIWWD